MGFGSGSRVADAIPIVCPCQIPMPVKGAGRLSSATCHDAIDEPCASNNAFIHTDDPCEHHGHGQRHLAF